MIKSRTLCGCRVAMLAVVMLMGASGCASWPRAETVSRADSTPPSGAILLEAGDEIDISFIGAPELNGVQTIRRDGRISLPIVGDIVARGMTVDTLKHMLTTRYASHLQTKEITVVVRSQPPVFVSGAVQSPGRIEMRRYMTALEAVMEAGGFDLDAADLKRVVVIRHLPSGRQEHRLNLGAVLAGRGGESFYLQPNDIVHVPKRRPWL